MPAQDEKVPGEYTRAQNETGLSSGERGRWHPVRFTLRQGGSVAAERPKIKSPAWQGWENLDVQGTLDEVVDALHAKAQETPGELEIRRMMPRKAYVRSGASTRGAEWA